MEEWTQESIQGLIRNKIEESSQREYKAANALGSSDGQKSEITKDVSAFANANGGMIIYGLAEYSDKQRKHLPERIDPVNRQEFSKEWLEQIIQQIQPKIEGVVIHPVSINDSATDVCYVVEIPQSATAHQARDRRYYKRSNFNVLQMEDYEIRDVMNRRGKPKCKASIAVVWGVTGQVNCLRVRFENIGDVLIHYMMIEVLFPLRIKNSLQLAVGEKTNSVFVAKDGFIYNHVKFLLPLQQKVVFPNSDIRWEEELRIYHLDIVDAFGNLVNADQTIHVAVYADELPRQNGKCKLDDILNKGWVSVC